MSTARLNEQQIAAVTASPEGPVLVIASPGSGKTEVLTERVAYLVGQYGVLPSRIVVTTFTRRAADEMKTRLDPLIGANAVMQLNIGTIHSICLKMLRDERMSKGVISDYEQKKIIQEELGYKRQNWDIGWRYPFSWILKAKASLITVSESRNWYYEKLLQLSSNNMWRAMDLSQKLSLIYKEYEDAKRNLNKMDFADMLMWVGQLLRDDEDFQSRWQTRIDYVLVDEVQDTSSLAYSILRTLAAPEDRFFAVGDPDQALFRWNGADPDDNVFGFLRHFPDGKMLPLEVNYRSTKVIVELCNRVISKNYAGEDADKLLFRKTLRPRPDVLDGLPVSVLEYEDVQMEAQGVCQNIMAVLEEGREPRDIFVVYRVNSQSRAIEDELLKHKVPYVVQGSLGYYDRKVIKDLIAYLTLVDDEHDDESFQRVCNIASTDFVRPTRGFGARWVQECLALASGNRESLWRAMLRMKPNQSKFQKRGIEDLMNLIAMVRHESSGDPGRAVMLLRRLCYESYLIRSEGVDERTAEDEGLFDDLDELSYVASQFTTIKELVGHVAEIRAMQAQREKEQVNAVVLTTVHRVKGLERPIVFGIGLSEKILPHKFAMGAASDPSDLPVENLSGIRDERCIVFVLITRAKEELYLSCPMSYRNMRVEPSRFIAEMGLADRVVSRVGLEEALTKEQAEVVSKG